MDNEALAIKLQEVHDRSIRNEGRIKKLESGQEELHKLATSVEVMAQQLQIMNKNVDELSGKVDTLESKPGKRFDAIVDKIIWAVMAAFVAFMLGKFGL